MHFVYYTLHHMAGWVINAPHSLWLTHYCPLFIAAFCLNGGTNLNYLQLESLMTLLHYYISLTSVVFHFTLHLSIKSTILEIKIIQFYT